MPSHLVLPNHPKMFPMNHEKSNTTDGWIKKKKKEKEKESHFHPVLIKELAFEWQWTHRWSSWPGEVLFILFFRNIFWPLKGRPFRFRGGFREIKGS